MYFLCYYLLGGDYRLNNRRKLLIVSFYLAKFNEVAVENLGYKNFLEACKTLGKKLDYSHNSVKNRRDDFDPLFGHRAGWHQVESPKSNLAIVDAFDHLSEEALRSIVLDLLEEHSQTELILHSDTSKDKQVSIYTTRGVTGKKAEEFFIKWHNERFPQSNLIDTRDLGCGFDFEVRNSKVVYEVKGLSGNDGGVLFTDKEWRVAPEKHVNYHLVLVRNCFSEEPTIEVYSNPHEKFSPKKQITTTINVNWGIKSNDLYKTNEE